MKKSKKDFVEGFQRFAKQKREMVAAPDIDIPIPEIPKTVEKKLRREAGEKEPQEEAEE